MEIEEEKEFLKISGKLIYLYDKAHQMDCLDGYYHSYKADLNCDDLDRRRFPSPKLLRKYKIKFGDANGFIWWLMEEYFKGNLELKNDGDKT